MNDQLNKKIELNIEITDDLKRHLKSEAALNGVALKEMAGWILVEFFKLPSEEKAARLAQWKSTTLTRVIPSPKRVRGNPEFPSYSPLQAPFLPPHVADSILHGIKIESGTKNASVKLDAPTGKQRLPLPALSTDVAVSERSL